jgi:hypothetical protein
LRAAVREAVASATSALHAIQYSRLKRERGVRRPLGVVSRSTLSGAFAVSSNGSHLTRRRLFSQRLLSAVSVKAGGPIQQTHGPRMPVIHTSSLSIACSYWRGERLRRHSNSTTSRSLATSGAHTACQGTSRMAALRQPHRLSANSLPYIGRRSSRAVPVCTQCWCAVIPAAWLLVPVSPAIMY